MASQDWFEKDFYAILGVPQDADAAAIKKAYRKLAKQYHPDRNPGDTAAEQKFKDIGEANAVLTDPEQRQEYDAVRAMSRGGARFTAGGPGGGNGGFEDIFSNMFGGSGGGGGTRVRFDTSGGGAASPDLEDLLRMFGQGGTNAGPSGGFGGFGGQRGPRRGADQEARTTLSFRDAVSGTTATLNVGGEKVTTRIPAGVKDGQKIRLRGKGRHGDLGASRGDLILTVDVQPHPVFSREGDNLVVDVPVTFSEATLGATIPVPTLDGQTVKVRVAPGTPSGRQLRLKGRGVATKTHTGDLIAKVVVTVPTELTAEQRRAVEALHELGAEHDPRADLMAKAKE